MWCILAVSLARFQRVLDSLSALYARCTFRRVRNRFQPQTSQLWNSEKTMLIKIAAMFRNLLISSFDATIRVKRAFLPAPASRGFASHVFLVLIYSEPKTHWNPGTSRNTPHGTLRGPSTESKGGRRKFNGTERTLGTNDVTYYDDASRQTKWRTVSVCADVRVSMER